MTRAEHQQVPGGRDVCEVTGFTMPSSCKGECRASRPMSPELGWAAAKCTAHRHQMGIDEGWVASNKRLGFSLSGTSNLAVYCGSSRGPRHMCSVGENGPLLLQAASRSRDRAATRSLPALGHCKPLPWAPRVFVRYACSVWLDGVGSWPRILVTALKAQKCRVDEVVRWRRL